MYFITSLISSEEHFVKKKSRREATEIAELSSVLALMKILRKNFEVDFVPRLSSYLRVLAKLRKAKPFYLCVSHYLQALSSTHFVVNNNSGISERT